MLSSGASGKESACQCRRHGGCTFNLWVRKIPWSRKMAACSSTLAWKIAWTEEPGRLQSMGLQRVRQDWATEHIYTEATMKGYRANRHYTSPIASAGLWDLKWPYKNVKDYSFERTASKHVHYQGWNRSPAQVGCMRQVLRPGALGRPRGIG